jgi:hypothetical protein
MRYAAIICLILSDINSLGLVFVLQKEISKHTDNFWIIWAAGFVLFYPIVFLSIKAIKELIKDEKK